MPKKSRLGLSAWAHAPSTRERNSKNILNQDLPIFKTVADPGEAIPGPVVFSIVVAATSNVTAIAK